MKAVKLISLIMVLLLTITAINSPVLQAQSNVRITKDIYVDKQLARSAGDSTYLDAFGVPITIVYPRTGALTEIRGQWPDSIRIISFTNGDSTASVRVHWKAAFKTGSTFTNVLLDSAYAATAIEATTGKTLTWAQYKNYDKWGISLLATTTGAPTINALNAATAAKVSVVLELWYHKPGSK